MGIFDLPGGYSEIKRVDLQKDKRLAILVNVGAVIIMAALYIVGINLVPLELEFVSDGLSSFLLGALCLLLAIVLYVLAHELIHGVFIKKFSGKKAKFGFTGLYAFAGSEAYFSKRQYVVIALAPVVLFGLIFLLLNIFLPREWFWWVYVIQIVNLSGAAGDFYVTALMSRMPADVLTRDEGVAMTIYSRAK